MAGAIKKLNKKWCVQIYSNPNIKLSFTTCWSSQLLQVCFKNIIQSQIFCGIEENSLKTFFALINAIKNVLDHIINIFKYIIYN